MRISSQAIFSSCCPALQPPNASESNMDEISGCKVSHRSAYFRKNSQKKHLYHSPRHNSHVAAHSVQHRCDQSSARSHNSSVDSARMHRDAHRVAHRALAACCSHAAAAPTSTSQRTVGAWPVADRLCSACTCAADARMNASAVSVAVESHLGYNLTHSTPPPNGRWEALRHSVVALAQTSSHMEKRSSCDCVSLRSICTFLRR